MRLLSIADDDIFISYARADATTYASGLANALTEKGFSCFIDRLGTDANENLPPMLLEKIRKSRMFILLCSPATNKSKLIDQELTEFINAKGTAKMVVPIIFDQSVIEQHWYKKVIGIATEIEFEDFLQTGNPTTAVINRIEKSFNYSKSKERLRIYTIGASITLAILLLASVAASIYASKQFKAARDAKSEVEKQQNIAIEQKIVADSAKDEARRQIQFASQQTEIAARATKKAHTAEQKTIEAIALQKSAEADVQLALEQLKDINIQLNDRQYELDVTKAFEIFRQGSNNIQFPSVDKADRQFTQVINKLDSLNLNPLIGLHARMATDLIDLKAQPIIDIEPSVSFVRLSENDKLLLVVYNHQNFGGSPDLEDIPDWTAFEVFDLTSGGRLIREPIKTTIGSFLYGLNESKILGFEESGHIIINHDYGDSIVSLERYSLKDGSSIELSDSEISKFKQKSATGNYKIPKGQQLIDIELSPEKLYSVPPDDGIDIEYGRRLVDMVVKESPNSRTMVVGTYEGKIMLLDLEAGHKRGEIMTAPVFAAEYTSDGKYVIVADESDIWKIDATGWPEINEISVPLLFPDSARNKETILELAISGDGRLIALASQYRLMVYNMYNERWVDWRLPVKLDRVAAMDIDINHQKVNLLTDAGSIFTADYITNTLVFKRSPLFASNCPIIGWIDPGEPIVWIACKSMSSSPIEVYKTSIYEDSAEFEKLTIQFPYLKHESNEYNKPEIHAIARIEDQLAFVFGDSESYQNHHPLISEQLMVATISPTSQGKIKTLYGFDYFVDNLGEPHWSIVPVYKISSVSDERRIMAQTELKGMMALSLDGNIRWVKSNLGSRDINLDKDGGYNIALDADKDSNIKLYITHLKRDVNLSYSLPWKFSNEPVFAVISPDGRIVAVASKEGDILIIDVSNYDIQR